jgi:hypothetical protein
MIGHSSLRIETEWIRPWPIRHARRVFFILENNYRSMGWSPKLPCFLHIKKKWILTIQAYLGWPLRILKYFDFGQKVAVFIF